MDTREFSRGSEWRKWDLHFHTPSSTDYDDRSVTDQDIITALEKENVIAVAITDHHFIDVERINKLRELSQNKITIFPGIEFCSDSRGEEPIHFIGIFSENSDVQYIWNEINSKANIAKQLKEGKKENEIYCNLKETATLIKGLGGLVTIHAGRKSNSIEKISNSLPVKMAEKEDIATHIQIFELGQERDQEDYIKKVFPKIGTRPMIICSDNHNAKKYQLKCNCWLKANPTFEGLRQVLHEPKDRIFIGNLPDILKQAEENPTKYVDSLTITQEPSYNGSAGKWFKDINIRLNHELVSIIGNKGKGKSAVAEIVGLCGNSKIREDDLSFLNLHKFKKSRLAQNFRASITLHSNLELSKNLNDNFSIDDVEYIKYIPQGYFNTLCNEIGKSRTFEEEIEKVVFQHLEPKNRLGRNSFSELIEYKKTIINKELHILHDDIYELNTSIIKLEKKKNTNYIIEIEKNIEKKQRELDAHDKNKPLEKIDPNKDISIENETNKLIKEIEGIKVRIGDIKNQIQSKIDDTIKLSEEVEELIHLRENIKLQYSDFERFRTDSLNIFQKYNLKVDEILKFTINISSIEAQIDLRTKQQAIIQGELDGVNEEEGNINNGVIGLKIQLANNEHDLTEKQKLLDKPSQEYQKYLADLEIWKKKRGDIEGTENTFDTLEYYKAEKLFIENRLNSELSNLRESRTNKLKNVFNKKAEIIDIYKSIKEKIDSILEKNKDYLHEYRVNIDASFELSPGFSDKFLWYINRKAAGSFYSIEGSEKTLGKILEDKNFNQLQDLIKFTTEIIDHLEFDKRDPNGNVQKNIEDQLKDIEGFYGYLFSLDYLTENYKLKLAGKDLSQLSPGEKGALLLVFYLLLDTDDKPLVIDQPEDNLDNQSVAEILVPFIKEAKKRRQIIMVTHNPNLAVVADAEQIIHVNIDKESGNEFSYQSGSIEEPVINKCIVDILEGTMPAFDNRKMKYKKG